MKEKKKQKEKLEIIHVNSTYQGKDQKPKKLTKYKQGYRRIKWD